MEKATTSQFKKLQQQMSCFIQIMGNIPPCPGDALQAARVWASWMISARNDDMEDDDELDDTDSQVFDFCMCCTLKLLLQYFRILLDILYVLYTFESIFVLLLLDMLYLG